MRSLLFMTLTILFCVSPLIAADQEVDTQNIAGEDIGAASKMQPFSSSLRVDAVSNSKIKKGLFKKDKLTYTQVYGDLGAVVYYNPNYSEGARLALGYTDTLIHWKHHPWVDQDNYPAVNGILTLFTKRWEGWLWRLQGSINLDLDHPNWEYTSYDFFVWGQYYLRNQFNLHFGVFSQLGLHMPRFWPIIGFDWSWSPSWKLSLVYPMNLSLEYLFHHNWSVAVVGRTFASRFRTSKALAENASLIRYDNMGIEVALKGQFRGISGNVHLGTTLGGKYRLANRHNRHAHTYHLKPAAYIGGEVDCNF